MNALPGNDFEKIALEQSRQSLLGELWDFVRCNKKWWLMPIIMVLLLLTAFLVLSSSFAAPFIYTLF